MNLALLAVVGAGGYLVGSIPMGLWIGRLVGNVDVRTMGSRRTGATNVQRSLGTRAGIAVLLLDFAKGAVPTIAALLITRNQFVAALAGLFAVGGHVWPVFAGFRGGRGVATGAGAVAALAPVVILCLAVTMAAVLVATRYVSLGSIVCASTSGLWAALLRSRVPIADAVIPLSLVVGPLILFTHAENVGRLVRGTESRLGRK